ncbi:MAG: transposase [Chthoniobacterales bacterium]|nr:transposase [Chthoniobacterales bacterium]
MSRANNTAHLLKAAADRHDAATRRTIAVIHELDRTGATATIAGVASAAHVSRSWLYEQPDLLDAATTLRDRTGPTPIPAAQRATNESLRQRLDAANIQIERLRTENSTLRDQLEHALGEQRIRR